MARRGDTNRGLAVPRRPRAGLTCIAQPRSPEAAVLGGDHEILESIPDVTDLGMLAFADDPISALEAGVPAAATSCSGLGAAFAPSRSRAQIDLETTVAGGPWPGARPPLHVLRRCREPCYLLSPICSNGGRYRV